MKQAFLCFETSPAIGAGHAIRSLVLANMLSEHGWACRFVTSAESYNFISALKTYDRIDPNDYYNFPEICDLLIIDNYDLSEIYENHFRPYSRKIMVIDDLANRNHDCDILLDQTYGREDIDYVSFLPVHCKVLAGSRYTLVRNDFVELRPTALNKRNQMKEVKRILISMGGSDPENYTLKALDIIKQSDFTGMVDIVLGFGSLNLNVVKEYIDTLINECNIYLNPNMAKLVLDADIAIGAAGSSMWERCCLGLPTLMINLSSDQLNISENLHKSGVAIKAGHIDSLNIEANAKTLNMLIESNNKRRTIQDKAFQVCDGLGAHRILEAINASN